MPPAELRSLLVGYGYEPLFVEGDEPGPMHQAMATALDYALDRIAEIREAAPHRDVGRPAWPDDRAAQPEGMDRTEDGRW